MWVMYGWMDTPWLREHLRCQLQICFFPQGLLRRGLGLDCKWPALLQVGCWFVWLFYKYAKNINNGLHYFLNAVVIAKKAFLNCQYQPWRSTRPAGAAIVNPEHCPRQDLQVFVIYLPNQTVCLLFVHQINPFVCNLFNAQARIYSLWDIHIGVFQRRSNTEFLN